MFLGLYGAADGLAPADLPFPGSSMRVLSKKGSMSTLRMVGVALPGAEAEVGAGAMVMYRGISVVEIEPARRGLSVVGRERETIPF